ALPALAAFAGLALPVAVFAADLLAGLAVVALAVPFLAGAFAGVFAARFAAAGLPAAVPAAARVLAPVAEVLLPAEAAAACLPEPATRGCACEPAVAVVARDFAAPFGTSALPAARAVLRAGASGAPRRLAGAAGVRGERRAGAWAVSCAGAAARRRACTVRSSSATLRCTASISVRPGRPSSAPMRSTSPCRPWRTRISALVIAA